MGDSSPRALSPGDRVDRYELVRQRAAGDASLWQARVPGDEGVVALRILPDTARDPAFVRRFLDEARIASAVAHPNVLQVFDVGQDGDTLFVVTEWLDGVRLAELHRIASARGEKIPLGVAMRIVADVAAGLHAAHGAVDEAGDPLIPVHGRLSLASVIVTREGLAKLTNFGVSASSGAPVPGSFAAPEQATRSSLDGRTDVFALGAMLRFLSLDAGAAPLAGAGRLAGTANDPALPRATAAIVARALARRPDERFATAAEMGVAIERAAFAHGLRATASDVAACVASLARGKARPGALAPAGSSSRERAGGVTIAASPDSSGSSAPPAVASRGAVAPSRAHLRTSRALVVAAVATLGLVATMRFAMTGPVHVARDHVRSNVLQGPASSPRAAGEGAEDLRPASAGGTFAAPPAPAPRLPDGGASAASLDERSDR